jgi:hypothetical protein
MKRIENLTLNEIELVAGGCRNEENKAPNGSGSKKLPPRAENSFA